MPETGSTRSATAPFPEPPQIPVPGTGAADPGCESVHRLVNDCVIIDFCRIISNARLDNAFTILEARPRHFVETESYIGPDRRAAPYSGKDRRKADKDD